MQCMVPDLTFFFFFFYLGTLLATFFKVKKNVGVDDLYLLSARIPCRVLSMLLPADKRNIRCSVNLIIRSVSCITWPFHL